MKKSFVLAVTSFVAFEDFPKDVPFKYVHAVKASKMIYSDPKSLRPAIPILNTRGKTCEEMGGESFTK
jgi:hypothetical protein